ncbi:MAG: TRAP transporter substrate-binding protein DctP, partial [Verrucomicrobiota bacterium]
LKVASVWPTGTTWYADLELAGVEVAEATEGRVEIVLEKASTLGDLPELGIYSLPLLFRSFEELEFVQSKMNPILTERFAAEGFTVWDIQPIGTANLFTNVEVTSLDAFLESRMWVPEQAEEVKFDEVGFKNPVPLDLRLLRDALRDEAIDSFALTPTAALLKRYHSRVGYVSKQPLTYVVAPLVIPTSSLESISPDDLAIVKEKFIQAFQKAAVTNRAKDADAMVLFGDREGLEVVADMGFLTDSWQTWAKGVWERVVGHESIDADVFHQVQGFIDEYRSKG